jgi:hypothetical protein
MDTNYIQKVCAKLTPKNRFIKGRIKYLFLLVPVIMIIFLITYKPFAGTAKVHVPAEKKDLPALALSLEYLEDTTRDLSLEQVRAKSASARFRPMEGSTLARSQNPSIWWIRLKLPETTALAAYHYLTVNNPNVAIAVLYLPLNTNGKTTYLQLHDGWHYRYNS